MHTCIPHCNYIIFPANIVMELVLV